VPSVNIKPEDVIANVNGHAIGKSALPQRHEPTNPGAEEHMLDEVISRELIWQDFAAQDLTGDPETQEKLNNLLRMAYSQVAADRYMKSLTISDDELRNSYEQKKSAATVTQYQVKHILLADEATANSVIAKLGKGEKFDKLVKAFSQDAGSKAKGGDLGWVDPRALGPEFAPVLTGLKKGEVTPQPIKTQHGWHVMLLEDTRIQEAPAFEAVKDKVLAAVRMEKFQEYIKTLKAKATITKGGEAKPEIVGANNTGQ
jgi:peptidyl-prolyl cis-trans isomerase C